MYSILEENIRRDPSYRLFGVACTPAAPFVQGANGLDYLFKSDKENDKLVWQ
jgi:hypothetical protein